MKAKSKPRRSKPRKISKELIDSAVGRELSTSEAPTPPSAAESLFSVTPGGPPEQAPEEKLERIEWFDDRYYRLESKGETRYLISVTSVLSIVNKPMLNRWRGDVGNYEADRRMTFAQWRGSRIHDAINKSFTSGDPISYFGPDGLRQFEQEEWLQLCKFAEWYALFKPQMKGSEIVVFDAEAGYAGTLDFPVILQAGDYPIGQRTVVTIPETGLYIGDLKTGKSVDQEYHLQTAAYARAYRLRKLGEPCGTFVLHTNSQTKAGFNVHLRLRPEMESDEQMFLNALRLHQWKNPSMTPEIFSMPSEIRLERY